METTDVTRRDGLKRHGERERERLCVANYGVETTSYANVIQYDVCVCACGRLVVWKEVEHGETRWTQLIIRLETLKLHRYPSLSSLTCRV